VDIQNLLASICVERLDLLTKGRRNGLGIILQRSVQISNSEKRIYIVRDLRKPLLLVNGPSLLGSTFDAALEFSGHGLIGAQGAFSNGLVDGVEVIQESLRDALFIYGR